MKSWWIAPLLWALVPVVARAETATPADLEPSPVGLPGSPGRPGLGLSPEAPPTPPPPGGRAPRSEP